jgi:phage terminase large subunit
MPSVEINPKVFNPVYIPYLDNMSRVQIYYGGASSGKSVFLAQRDVIDVMKGGRNFLIVRQVGRTLRGSVVQEIVKIINEWELQHLFKINKTDNTITCVNGYQIIFAGLDDVEKLKSLTPAKGVFTDVRIEEATEIDKDSLKQLLKRQRGGSEEIQKRLTMAFNPIMLNHWIYQEYFASIAWTDTQTEYISPELSILKTTYRDNKFLTTADIDGLLSEKDSYYFDVYTEGKWGILGGVIFTNWHMADLNDPNDPYYLPEEQRTNRRNGLDFGFSQDPAAAGTSHYDKMRKRIYVFKELYETGLTNDVLAERLKEMIGTERVTCDSAEPKSIQELRNCGISAVGARKGKDSVNFGIDWLKQQEIIIDKSCINARNEMQQYHWKKDAGGNSLKIPVDKNNHLIDGGLRYAYEDDMEGVDASKLLDFA